MLDPVHLQEIAADVYAAVDVAVQADPEINNYTEEEVKQIRQDMFRGMYTQAITQAQERQVQTAAAQWPPPPDPVAHAISAHTSAIHGMQPKPLTATTLAASFPLKLQRDFTAAVGTALGGETSLPPRQDLRGFWQRCERAIEGLSTQLKLADLANDSIHQLAPHLLGSAVYELFSKQQFAQWQTFKDLVNERFCLTPEELKEAFYNISYDAYKDPYRFILDVEDKRSQLAIDEDACYFAFIKCLPDDFKQEMDNIRKVAVHLGHKVARQLTWRDLVNQAVFETSGSRLTSNNNGANVRWSATTQAPTQPGAAAAAVNSSSEKIPKSPRRMDKSFHNNEVKCALCVELGRESNAVHTLDNCWRNPKNPNHRPNLVQAALRDIKRNNKAMPELLKDVQLLPKPPEPVPKMPETVSAKVDTAQLQAFGRDLISMLEGDDADFHKCLEDAAVANLNLEVNEVPDGAPSFMFKDASEEEGEADFQATTKAQLAHNKELLRQHLKTLAQFSEADLIAALSDDEEGAVQAEGDMDMDAQSSAGSVDSSDSGGQEPVLSAQELLRAMREKVRAGKIKHTSVGTGGVKDSGKVVNKPPPKVQDNLQRLCDRMKVAVPLSQALELKPNLRGLLANLVAEAAHKQGVPVRLVTGTKVVEVAYDQLMSERKIMLESHTDDVAGVERQMKKLHLKDQRKADMTQPIAGKRNKQDRAALIQEVAEKAAQLLAKAPMELEEEEESDEEDTVDGMFHSRVTDPVQPTSADTQAPEWADTVSHNCRGRVPLSNAHYYACVQVKGAVCEAVLDCGGARTMIDSTLAEAMGLQIKRATRERSFGCFWGPNGEKVRYFGRVPGPLSIRFGQGVEIEVPEIKVIRHPEPLLLIGTDILSDSRHTWRFAYIGIHHTTRKGVMVCTNDAAELVYIPLVWWPMPINAKGEREARTELPLVQTNVQTKKVTFAEPESTSAPKEPPGMCNNRASKSSGNKTVTDPSSNKKLPTSWPWSETRAGVFDPAAIARIKYGTDMTSTFEDKEEGWQDWLASYNLMDSSLGESEAYLRYLKFKDVTFDEVPKDQWHCYFADLAKLEAGLVFGDAIGYSPEYPLQMTITDATPIKSKPIQYAKRERDWIKAYVGKQIRLGVLREIQPGEAEPTFVQSVVLVKNGQTQQDYRFCGNFVEANTRVADTAQPLIDCQAALDGLQGCEYFSAIDIKAGFNNLPVPEQLQAYLGIVTQDKLLTYQRMPFGLNVAPAVFQRAMNHILGHGSNPPNQSTYMDDCTPANATPDAAWKDTIECITRLINAGLPINIKKCQFMVRRLLLLGVVLAAPKFHLGKKAMRKFFGGEIPTNITQLMGLLGRLNFASQFVPDYRRRVSPLVALLGKNSSGNWTQEHTQCLNQLAEVIHARVQLTLCDPTLPAKLHVDVDGEQGGAILTQGEGESIHVIAMCGRELTRGEVNYCRMEQLMVVANWALKCLGRYTFYLPHVTLVVPTPAELSILGVRQLPVRLQMQLIELTSMVSRVECGLGAWALQSRILDIARAQLNTEEEEGCQVWEHVDTLIRRPTLPTDKAQEQVEGAYILHFDGGCTKRRGSGGALLWDPGGECIAAEYYYLGADRPTNNTAEAQALVNGLSLAKYHVPAEGKLIVRGDSLLITQFMLGMSKPGQKLLVSLIKEAKDEIKGKFNTKVTFQHIAREHNQWADWLARVGQAQQRNGQLQQALPQIDLRGQPPKELGADHILFIQSNSGHGQHECPICDLQVIRQEAHCWGCGKLFHVACLPWNDTPKFVGPWHCPMCLLTFKQKAVRDLTLDQELLHFLGMASRPSDPLALQRVLRLSNHVSLDTRGHMWVHGDQQERPRRVPPLRDRQSIISESAKMMAHPSGQRLYQLLKSQFYWPGMRADCLAQGVSSQERQLTHARFPAPPYLHPTEKGASPFTVWSVDTLTHLTPTAPDGSSDVIVAVDNFTGWVEVGALPKLNSHETQTWFHNNVTCRYGVPTTVRSDKGVEYQGEFDAYLLTLGVKHRFIATLNPRANGMAERNVRSVVEAITRMLATCPARGWWEFLGEVAFGIRTLTKRATGFSPYLLVFKQDPQLPIPAALRAQDPGEHDVLKEEELGKLIVRWRQVIEDADVRRSGYDKAMIRSYLRRHSGQATDVRFVFAPGDYVILRARVPKKMQCRAAGPYVFIKYTGQLGVTAKICNQRGKQYEVSAANLLPFQAEYEKRMLRYHPGWEPWQEQDGESDITLSSDSIGNTLPPGVVLVPTGDNDTEVLHPGQPDVAYQGVTRETPSTKAAASDRKKYRVSAAQAIYKWLLD